MNVLILYAQPVFWSMGEGCGAAIFANLPTAIASRGHHVRVSMPDGIGARRSIEDQQPAAGSPRPDATTPEVETYRGFELHRAPAGRGFIPDPDLPLVARLRERAAAWLSYQRWAVRAAEPLARALRPDLIIGMGFYEAPAARRLARRFGVPNVTRLFGNNLSIHLDHPFRFYANFPEVIALKTPAARIILNDDGADGRKVVARLRVPTQRVIHLRNGVDFDRFKPGPPAEPVLRHLGMRPGQPLLLTATRLAPEKMLGRAIEGLAQLVRAVPDAILALLGDGPERQPLHRLARQLGVEHRVRFPGPVAQLDLPAWYQTADLVLSLLDRTNAANPVFEAMACGRTVVALDAGTTRDVVVDGVTGVVLPREDLPRLGTVLTGLLRDPERRRVLGAAARMRIGDLVMDMKARLDYEVDLLEEAAGVAGRRGGDRGQRAGHDRR